MKSIITRSIFISVILITLFSTSCSSNQQSKIEESIFQTQTSIVPEMPLLVLTSTFIPTLEPSATVTATPSLLEKLAPWQSDMTSIEFPIFDKRDIPTVIDEALVKLVINKDGSSTYNNVNLFSANAPKASMQKILLSDKKTVEIVAFPRVPGLVKFTDWAHIIAVYQVDTTNNSISQGTAEYRAIIAINAFNGVFIWDILMGLQHTTYQNLEIDNILSKTNDWSYISITTGSQNTDGVDTYFPPFRQLYDYDASTNTFNLKPGYSVFIDAVNSLQFIQFSYPTSARIDYYQ